MNVVYVYDLSFLEADMFLVLIQAMGGWGITFLGQLYYHLGFTVCIFFWQWVTNLSHYIMFHFWFYSFSVYNLFDTCTANIWEPMIFSPPKNEWRILFAMMIIIILINEWTTSCSSPLTLLPTQNFRLVSRTHAASRKGLLDGAVDPPSFSAGVVDPVHSFRDMPVNLTL